MPFPLASPFSIRRFNFFCLQVLLTRASLQPCLNLYIKEGVNGVNRLATNGKKYYRLPTKREKNQRLLTGKSLADYRHEPTLSIFFSERRVYCIFSTFLVSNQRYHVRSVFTNIPQNEDIEIGLAGRMPKISTTCLVLHIKCEK